MDNEFKPMPRTNYDCRVDMAWAMTEDGEFVHAEDVDKRDKTKKYYCIKCYEKEKDDNGNPLLSIVHRVARNPIPDKNYDGCKFFRHNRHDKKSYWKVHEGSKESFTHSYAKVLLMRKKELYIPPVTFRSEFPNKRAIKEGEVLHFTDVKTEIRKKVVIDGNETAFIPDAIGIYEKDGQTKELFIEFYVTHTMSNDKWDKMKKYGVSTVQIKLDELRDNHEGDKEYIPILEDFLFNTETGAIQSNVQWTYNEESEKFYQELVKIYEDNHVKSKEFKYIINNKKVCQCPQWKWIQTTTDGRKWGSATIGHCKKCKYALHICEIEKIPYVKCLASIKDIKKVDELLVPYACDAIMETKGQFIRCGAKYTIKFEGTLDNNKISELRYEMKKRGFYITIYGGNSLISGNLTILYNAEEAKPYKVGEKIQGYSTYEYYIIYAWERAFEKTGIKQPLCLITQDLNKLPINN